MTAVGTGGGVVTAHAEEEARAIVAYLEYRRDADSHGIYQADINAALDQFWRRRTEEAPTQDALRRHLQAEAEYIKDLKAR